MTRITRWHTAWGWALAACWLVGSIMAVSAQDGRWERVTAAGVKAFAQGDYAEAARQFHVALPLADAGSLSTSLIKRLLMRFERIQQRHYGMKLMAYTLINLRAFCGA